jgi:prepilin-type N-terminal cleavage/methylation domain-containing protein
MMKRSEMKRLNTGFTLVELMAVLAVTGILAMLAVLGYNRGIYKEYVLSQQMRSLVNAIHVAQWRALQNKFSVPITTGQSTGAKIDPGGWYPQVTFDTSTKHGFAVGEMVIFANLNAHTSLNVGRYYVASVPADTQFTVDWFTQIEDTDLDQPQLGSTEVPTVFNTKTSSQIILMKRSYVNSLTTAAERKKVLEDPQSFVYDDVEIRVWDANDTTLTALQIDDVGYQVTIAFDGRGLPTNPAGYQLALGKSQADKVVRKFVTVSPTGRIAPGS